MFDSKTKRWRKPTDREAMRMCEEDHQLFSKGKGLKGQEAIDSVQRNWSKSHIARLSYRSNGRMAVNQASEIYLGIDPVSKAQPKAKKKAAKGASMPITRPIPVAADKGIPQRLMSRGTPRKRR